MSRIILVLISQLVFILSLFANNDGGKTISATQVENKSDYTSIYVVIDNSLNKLCDSANIWWTSKSMVSDSILNTTSPVYPTYIYEQRINYLNELSPIKFNYNKHVQVYIDAYGLRNRDKLKLVMSKSTYYFPIFEEYLSRYGLPLELKYLAAVESALDPNAISKSGAVGLWQFMKPTGDLFDLRVTSYIDERRDVYKSTDAACRYLKYLFNTFGDWQLALVAYNGGPGTVKKAIARSGGKTDYWELRPYLSNEMQSYVPAFIAMNYLMEYHAEHNIFPEKEFIEAYKTDTIQVFGPLRIAQISQTVNYNLEKLKALNPVYLYSYIPADGKYHPLVLPHELTQIFLDNNEEIYAAQAKDSTIADSVSNDYQVVRKERNNVVYHNVVSGDNFFRLAMRYNCSVAEIYKWNQLPDNYMLKIGDRLKLFVE
ncbi:MAG: transglycosylase SLT domain-containing protein [Bacteroidales bacterium]|nr:transglycosylase SLT domain-containing protein [Bacteroidales bacterium]MDD4217333.1 transglycosylase SLT domain-containing protein [Bacteroidales bacterium]MDY0142048.1 transglycosylase SLT domain-containing protein [Bacteroidales bacterium]